MISRNQNRCAPWALPLALTMGLTFVGSRPVCAELTVENLTGTAVTGVGPFQQDVSDAIRKFAARDYAGTLAHLEKAKKSTPRLAPPEVMMAQLYFDGNLPVQGVATLEKAISQAPQDPEALVMFAERAVREGRWTEAGLLIERAASVLDRFNENPRRKQNLLGRAIAAGATADENAQNWSRGPKETGGVHQARTQQRQCPSTVGQRAAQAE